MSMKPYGIMGNNSSLHNHMTTTFLSAWLDCQLLRKLVGNYCLYYRGTTMLNSLLPSLAGPKVEDPNIFPGTCVLPRRYVSCTLRRYAIARGRVQTLACATIRSIRADQNLTTACNSELIYAAPCWSSSHITSAS
ncbi:hypothetical protein DPEC_G00321310 [Dallia pectoralis]|uniref:Uncharacterized protein n=1 Tax=Dallia pectoralis TaxID=75939 RepID=A0ACC2FAB2_DALPE|nr:hypothetical protein DPEC_G00321310 [Dallia pectoralis]